MSSILDDPANMAWLQATFGNDTALSFITTTVPLQNLLDQTSTGNANLVISLGDPDWLFTGNLENYGVALRQSANPAVAGKVLVPQTAANRGTVQAWGTADNALTSSSYDSAYDTVIVAFDGSDDIANLTGVDPADLSAAVEAGAQATAAASPLTQAQNALTGVGSSLAQAIQAISGATAPIASTVKQMELLAVAAIIVILGFVVFEQEHTAKAVVKAEV
jgi:hypothetical protein